MKSAYSVNFLNSDSYPLISNTYPLCLLFSSISFTGSLYFFLRFNFSPLKSSPNTLSRFNFFQICFAFSLSSIVCNFSNTLSEVNGSPTKNKIQVLKLICICSSDIVNSPLRFLLRVFSKVRISGPSN